MEEEGREQSKGRRQTKLMAASIGDALHVQKTSSNKKTEKLSCFKCKKQGHMARIAQSHHRDPVRNAPKQDITNGIGGWTIPAPREGLGQPRLLSVLAKATDD
jgi:hypothetical protein